MEFLIKVLAVLLLIGILGTLGMLVLTLTDLSSWDIYLPMAGIFFLIGAGAFALFATFSFRKFDREPDMIYNSDTKTLTVYAIKPRNKSCIKIEALKDYKLEYHPSETVYTGATVGGVHMGGFHQTEDYYTAKTWGTGKAELIYNSAFDQSNTGPIKEIEFSDKLMETLYFPYEIEQFKVNNRLLLSHHENSDLYTEDIESSINRGDGSTAFLLLKQAAIDKQLTRSECIAIRNFLGKKIKK